jgi:geranylgeranyl diphosphate synthase, type I
VDDLLGIWGRPDTTGKPVAGDLRAHKKTLPIVAALAELSGGSAPQSDRQVLARFLSNGQLTEDDVMLAVSLIERAGGRERCLAEADHQLQLALRSLDRVQLRPGPLEELAELARFVAARDF